MTSSEPGWGELRLAPDGAPRPDAPFGRGPLAARVLAKVIDGAVWAGSRVPRGWRTRWRPSAGTCEWALRPGKRRGLAVNLAHALGTRPPTIRPCAEPSAGRSSTRPTARPTCSGRSAGRTSSSRPSSSTGSSTPRRPRPAGSGVILAGVHLGGWEVATAVPRAELPVPTSVIVADDWLAWAIAHMRVTAGLRVIYRTAPAIRAARLLQAGEALLVLGDDGWGTEPRTYPVRFLDSVADLPAGVVTLSRLCQSPIVGFAVLPTGRRRWRVVVDQPIGPPGRTGGAEEEQKVLQILADRWSELIRAHPEHWAAAYRIRWRERQRRVRVGRGNGQHERSRSGSAPTPRTSPCAGSVWTEAGRARAAPQRRPADRPRAPAGLFVEPRHPGDRAARAPTRRRPQRRVRGRQRRAQRGLAAPAVRARRPRFGTGTAGRRRSRSPPPCPSSWPSRPRRRARRRGSSTRSPIAASIWAILGWCGCTTRSRRCRAITSRSPSSTGEGLAARAGGPWVRAAWRGYAPLVAIVVVATGNHFVVDVAAGAALGVLARRLRAVSDAPRRSTAMAGGAARAADSPRRILLGLLVALVVGAVADHLDRERRRVREADRDAARAATSAGWPSARSGRSSSSPAMPARSGGRSPSRAVRASRPACPFESCSPASPCPSSSPPAASPGWPSPTGRCAGSAWTGGRPRSG